MNISLSRFAPENLVLQDGFGSSPVPRQLAHLHTQTESGAYWWDSSRFPRRCPFIYSNRHTPSGQSRVYRVTQLHTDGVHCREHRASKPQGSSKRVLPGEVTMDQSICAPLSHTHNNWYEVGMLKVPAVYNEERRTVERRAAASVLIQ